MRDAMEATNRPAPFRVGDFLIDPGLNTIVGPETTRQIEPKAMQVLCVLSQRAGETVSRDELLQEVWPGRVIVEETLTRTVSQLRHVFGDYSSQPRYIQTVPKRGYRLIAPVSEIEPTPTAAATVESPNKRRRLWWSGLAALLVITGLGAYFLGVSFPDGELAAPSVAVLPFEPLNSTDENAFLAEGIAEQLLGALASVPDLRVPSRHSSFAFRGDDHSLEDIAAALDVRHVLEGSLRRSGDTLRISARLVDVASDTTVWARQYDGELERIFEVEEQIAAGVIRALEGTLLNLDAAQSGFARPDDLDAYSLFLQGNYWWMNGTTGNWFYQARDAFEQAVELDPDFAEAHASLAYIYARHDFHDRYMPSDEAHARAEAAIERALSLDADAADAYHARAALATSRGDFEQATKALDRALQIRPRNPVAHYLYSELHLARNQPIRALDQANRALELDPFSPWVNVNQGIVRYHLGDLDAAAQSMATAIRIDPDYTWAYVWQAMVLHAQGRLDNAIASMQRCLELDPASESNAALMGLLYLDRQEFAQARKWFEHAASLHGDGNKARLWGRLVALAYHREDDDILMALTASLGSLHNSRYSIVPVLHGAAVQTRQQKTIRDRLLAAAPELEGDAPHVRPRHAPIALALAALARPSAPARADALLAAVEPAMNAYPERFESLGLRAQWLMLRGREDDAIDALEQAVETRWLRYWWMLPHSPVFAPVRDTPAFQRVIERARERAKRSAADLPR